jgi:predicted nucleotidyltransferase
MFKKLLTTIARQFEQYDIPYIIVGGQAVLLYGEPRLTKDIDITIGLNIDSVDKIVKIMEDISLKPIPNDFHQFVKQTMVLPMLEQGSGIRVDVIFSFSQFEQDAVKRANIVEIDNTRLCYTSLEDLIIFKIFSGRPRDIEDARKILIKNRNANIQYIKKQLGTLSFEEKDLLKEFNLLLTGI